MKKVIFISGIDTDAGKTFATGWLARQLIEKGEKVATLKFIQTGCDGFSEDIEMHRKIMGCELPEDSKGLTSPIIFKYPASAQLAARLDGKEIDLSLVDNAIEKLKENYDYILVEGAGGLMVPITDDFLSIDYPLTRNLPVILVTNGILGSINHTILSFEALSHRKIKIEAVVYNTYFDNDDIISNDTQGFIKRYLHNHHPEVSFISIPDLKLLKNT